uniref:Bestrophin homolog n=1 Tax=Heterorhabditis bacteriophora TaxID=37862 RepID=A0A1I7WMH4_HETBA
MLFKDVWNSMRTNMVNWMTMDEPKRHSLNHVLILLVIVKAVRVRGIKNDHYEIINRMAYNYHYDIATSKAKVIFKLLLRWRGSVWRAVYVELIVWLLAYAGLSVVYRFALSSEQRQRFENFAHFCDKRMGYIPMNFMLGFFVTVVVNRWVTQFSNLGMIDNIALFTSTYVKGNDERGRNLRRNIVRYCCLSQCLVFRDIHLGVRKRFPTLETLVAAEININSSLILQIKRSSRRSVHSAPVSRSYGLTIGYLCLSCIHSWCS